MSTSEFTALYYPFSRTLNEETLKRGVLLYDRLLFIDPTTPKVREGLYSAENHQPYLPYDAARRLSSEWSYIATHYKLLQDQGAIGFVDPIA